MLDETQLSNLLRTIVAEALTEVKDYQARPYSRQDVMNLLSIKETTLWQMQQNGTLHPFKVGGKVLFERSEVDNLITNRTKRKGA